MATVDSVRTLLDTFEAYGESDFDRLAELYAEDVTWDGSEPGPGDCKNREDVFGMFRVRIRRGGKLTVHQILSIGPRVLLVGDFDGNRIVNDVHGGGRAHRARSGL
jgi:ketosteroid isomerase-like protein